MLSQFSKRRTYYLAFFVVAVVLYKIFTGFPNADDSSDGPGPREHANSFKQKTYSQQKRAQNATRGDLMRSMEYCNEPGENIHNEEGDVDSDYKLISVHAVIRHGQRSAVNTLPNMDNAQLSCVLDKSTSENYTRLISAFLDYVKANGHFFEHHKSLGLYPHKNKCFEGQLTGAGFLQHLAIGEQLRKAYTRKHTLFSDKIEPEEVLAKSTGYTRTYQSGLAFLFGLLPHVDLHKIKIRVEKNLLFCDAVNSGGSCHCPAAPEWRDASLQVSDNSTAKHIKTITRDVSNDITRIFDVNTFDTMGFPALMDGMMEYVCNAVPLPCSKQSLNRSSKRCVTFEFVNKIWHFLDFTGAIMSDAEYKSNLLSIYPLLREIAKSMTKNVLEEGRTKFRLYSGHDVTIKPLVKILGIYNGHWPPYASRVIFELYSSVSQNKYFIRILYNGVDKTRHVRFCKNIGDGKLCPFDNFAKFVFTDIFKFFGKQSYQEICSTT